MLPSDNKFMLSVSALALVLFVVIGLLIGWTVVAILLTPIALLAAFLAVMLIATKAFDQ
jgi:hypothetical protein